MPGTAVATRRRGGGVQRAPNPTGLAEVVDRVRDKGLVSDVHVRAALPGIALLTTEARTGAASAGTYLRVAQAGTRPALVGDGPGDRARPSRRNVMAHTTVLQEVVAAGADVLPMQFGVVMPDGDAVRDELLGAHGETLAAQLDALAGRVELDVTV